jgi:hypothetical protein
VNRYAPGSIALTTALLAACTSVSDRDDITCGEYQQLPAAMAARLFPGAISYADIVECRHTQPTAAFAYQVCAIKLRRDAAEQVTFIRFDRLHALRDGPVPALVQNLANAHGIKLAYFYRRMNEPPFYYLDEAREYIVGYGEEFMCHWPDEIITAGLAHRADPHSAMRAGQEE